MRPFGRLHAGTGSHYAASSTASAPSVRRIGGRFVDAIRAEQAEAALERERVLAPALRGLGVEADRLDALAARLREHGVHCRADVTCPQRCALVGADHPLREVEPAAADAGACGPTAQP